ncbi:MAG: hypothetical protein VKJ04_04900 [Vampirovibrionales bacterium]|nr:hypothetical protein [Vampirovibrionales bacterium]
MKQILGVILIILGVVYFSLKGFQYTTQEKVLDIGPIEASAQQEKQVLPYSPVIGGAIILGGVVLLMLGVKQKS